MPVSASFFIVASLCAVGYALITVVSAWMLSRTHQAYTTLENAVAFRDDRHVIVRHWLVLVSFFFTLVAYAGIAARVVARTPMLALLGFCFHLIFHHGTALAFGGAFRPAAYLDGPVRRGNGRTSQGSVAGAHRRFFIEHARAGFCAPVHLSAKALFRNNVAYFKRLYSQNAYQTAKLFLNDYLSSLLNGFAVWSEVLFDRLVSVTSFVKSLWLLLRLAEGIGGQRGLAALNRRLCISRPGTISDHWSLAVAWLVG